VSITAATTPSIVSGTAAPTRGRLDEGRTAPIPSTTRRELVEAMRAIAARATPSEQFPSVGCSIKWKTA
jgi:hypothetical protein